MIYLAKYVNGDFSAKSMMAVIGMAQTKTWVEFFISSMAPVLALGFTYFCGRRKVSRFLIYLFSMALVAAMFFISQWSYEFLSEIRGYYWHEMFLGTYLLAAYYLAAGLSRGVIYADVNALFATGPESRPTGVTA